MSLIREDLLLSLQAIYFLFGKLFRMAVIVRGQKGEEGSPLYISSLYYMINEDSLAHAFWMMQEEHSVKDAGLCCSSWLMCGPYGTVAVCKPMK